MLAFFVCLAVVGVSLLIGGLTYWVISRGDEAATLPAHPTGREVAVAVLAARDVRGVQVVAGEVDCYAAPEREVRLAGGRLDRASASATAIGAHEAIHASQDTSRWRWFRLAGAVTVASLVVGPIGLVLLGVGAFTDRGWAQTAGLVLVAPVVLAAVLTTVVEVDAVRRALQALRGLDGAPTIDRRRVRRVLVACGATYVTEAVFDPGFALRRITRR